MIAHAQSMQVREQPASGLCNSGGDCTFIQVKRTALMTQAHRDGQRVAGGGEMVADDAAGLAMRCATGMRTDRRTNPGDDGVHLFDQSGRFGHPVDGQAPQAMKIGGTRIAGHFFVR